jgi:hypothetical protein
MKHISCPTHISISLMNFEIIKQKKLFYCITSRLLNHWTNFEKINIFSTSLHKSVKSNDSIYLSLSLSLRNLPSAPKLLDNPPPQVWYARFSIKVLANPTRLTHSKYTSLKAINGHFHVHHKPLQFLQTDTKYAQLKSKECCRKFCVLQYRIYPFQPHTWGPPC